MTDYSALYADTESRLLHVLREVGRSLTDLEQREVITFLNAREYGLALETLSSILVDESKPINSGVLLEIDHIADAMQLRDGSCTICTTVTIASTLHRRRQVTPLAAQASPKTPRRTVPRFAPTSRASTSTGTRRPRRQRKPPQAEAGAAKVGMMHVLSRGSASTTTATPDGCRISGS